MIYITGDTHSDFERFSTDIFYEQKEMDNQDENFMIITGDFGGVWDQEESKNEKWWLDWLENKPFTTLFVDGNHENFDRLNSYPMIKWNGGFVHVIRHHVLHLMRGQVFTIEDKKFFTFGGASSHDISGGILELDDPDFKEKRQKLDRMGALYRVNHVSWWKQELPTEYEMETGRFNLAKHNNKVDFIISHSPSTSELYLMGGKGLYETDILTNYLEEIKATTEYKRHIFGHMHVNKAINDRDICLYEQIIRIN
jgi:hypothetical protein